MKRILKRITQITVATALLGLATVYALSEIGPEVVTVETFAPDGTPVSTRLWIVDAGGHPWLQAALPWAEDWLQRMEARPRVVVHRVTGVRQFDAVLVREPEAAERVQALMRAKYGMRDLLVSLSGLVKDKVPIRLDPVPVAQGPQDSVTVEAAQPEEEPTGPTAARWRARSLDEESPKRP